jgi:hypothetical protein
MDLPTRQGNTNRQRYHDTRQRLPVLDGIESRAMPIFLKDNVLVAAHDERGGVLFAGVVRGSLQSLRIERLDLRGDARCRWLIAACDLLTRLV